MAMYKKTLLFVLIGIVFNLQLGVFTVTANSNLSETSVAAKENSGIIPLIWTVAIVGGCIAITLSYVSWRKYKGEQKQKVEKDKIVD